MQDFRFFESKSTLIFKKIVASGVDMGKIKFNMVNYLKYINKDFEKNMELYSTSIPNIDSINFTEKIDNKYRFFFRTKNIRSFVQYLKELQTKANEFKGKESNFKVLIGTYFLYYVLVVKFTEMYLGAVAVYNGDHTNVTFKSLGLDNTVMKYFKVFEDLREKSIDEWLELNIDKVEEKFYLNAMKRIFNILGAV